ncbi:LytTR family transcriptional regulator DNA-binding domain-containing protein [Paenibacillus yanchengensis]|uniref:LytTR family transcriptional regulator DNA-binding domain-containing protein n=1 Tax=Paenibacillus yanchengensis TaxID=2035833 RepID=A0ABW4YLX8_9BACL
MNEALQQRNMYEDFNLEQDILFFKIGTQSLVSFHGNNYNIKKRVSSNLLQQYISNPNFFKISSTCYVNLSKIKTVASGTIYFGTDIPKTKRINVNRRKQSVIKQLFDNHMSIAR